MMRFTLPEEKRLVHSMVIPIRWGDMDAMGHVNNTVYFRYMETVRLDWIFKAGAALDMREQGPVIVNAFCNFLGQLEHPGDLQVTMFVANAGRSSFETYHTIERVDQPGLTWAEGGAKVVWTDYQARKSMAIPDGFRQQLQA
jgi:acyl-CoA thioester hydrolase